MVTVFSQTTLTTTSAGHIANALSRLTGNNSNVSWDVLPIASNQYEIVVSVG